MAVFDETTAAQFLAAGVFKEYKSPPVPSELHGVSVLMGPTSLPLGTIHAALYIDDGAGKRVFLADADIGRDFGISVQFVNAYHPPKNSVLVCRMLADQDQAAANPITARFGAF